MMLACSVPVRASEETPYGVTTNQDVNQLKAELQAQRQRQADLEDKINQLEARQKLKERTLDQKVEQVATQQEKKEEPKEEGKKKEGAIPDILQWASKVGLYGDFRYRYEYIGDDSAESDRHRNRIRARLGLDAKVNDEWNLGFRLATAGTQNAGTSGDPVSTNQDLNESFSKKPIWIDLAYFNYHPGWIKGLGITGGKGHWFSFNYVLAKNVVPGITYYLSQYQGRKGDADYDRLMADIVLKF
jgi:hypothetical protein